MRIEDNLEKFKNMLEKARVEDIKSDKSNKVFILILAILVALIQCSVNILACLIYAYDTYVTDNETQTALNFIDLWIAIFFTFEMMANFYFYPKPKYRFFLSVDTWIDFLTVFPEYLSWAFTQTGGFDVSFLRILRVFKIVRILKFQKTLRKINLNSSSNEQFGTMPAENFSRLKKQLILLLVSLFATFFIAAGFVLFLQEVQQDAYNDEIKHFDTAIYFVTITATSIGYGDLYPKTEMARFSISIIILCSLFVFGGQITKIVSIIRESDEFDVYYSLNKHTVIFSANSFDLITNFLADYYEKVPDTKVLVIGEREMGKIMKPLLDLSYLEGKLYFLSMGKGFDQKAMEKSSIKKCEEVYFLNDPHSSSAEDSDKRALFLKTFLVNNGVTARFYIQLSTHNEVHVIKLERDINKSYIKEHIKYLQEKDSEDSSDESLELAEIEAISYMKLIFKIFAKNTFWEGFIPFITWFMSYNDSEIDLGSSVFDKFCQTYHLSRNSTIYNSFLPSTWLKMNFEEAALEISKINLHEKFKYHGRKISLIGISRENKTK